MGSEITTMQKVVKALKKSTQNEPVITMKELCQGEYKLEFVEIKGVYVPISSSPAQIKTQGNVICRSIPATDRQSIKNGARAYVNRNILNDWQRNGQHIQLTVRVCLPPSDNTHRIRWSFIENRHEAGRRGPDFKQVSPLYELKYGNETKIHKGISSIRIRLSNTAGDMCNIRASVTDLNEENAIETGMITMWNRLEIEYAHCTKSPQLDMNTLMDCYEGANLELAVTSSEQSESILNISELKWNEMVARLIESYTDLEIAKRDARSINTKEKTLGDQLRDILIDLKTRELQAHKLNFMNTTLSEDQTLRMYAKLVLKHLQPITVARLSQKERPFIVSPSDPNYSKNLDKITNITKHTLTAVRKNNDLFVLDPGWFAIIASNSLHKTTEAIIRSNVIKKMSGTLYPNGADIVIGALPKTKKKRTKIDPSKFDCVMINGLIANDKNENLSAVFEPNNWFLRVFSPHNDQEFTRFEIKAIAPAESGNNRTLVLLALHEFLDVSDINGNRTAFYPKLADYLGKPHEGGFQVEIFRYLAGAPVFGLAPDTRHDRTRDGVYALNAGLSYVFTETTSKWHHSNGEDFTDVTICHEFGHALRGGHMCGNPIDPSNLESGSCAMNEWYMFMMKTEITETRSGIKTIKKIPIPWTQNRRVPKLCEQHKEFFRKAHIEDNPGLWWK